MRLIDADNINFHCNYDGDCTGDIDDCKECGNYICDFRDIQEQPTAYNPDKVVEELKSLQTYNMGFVTLMSDLQRNGVYRHYVCLEDAIEIVKLGGVADD